MPTTPIQFAITDLDVGGAERMLCEIVLGLDRSFWNPTVVCLKPPGVLADRLAQAGIPVHSLAMGSTVDLARSWFRWRSILRVEQPRILQTFLFHANFLGALVGRNMRVPYILGGIRVAQRRGNWHLRLDRWVWKNRAIDVCVSSAVAKFTQEQLACPADRLVVIPNGIADDFGVNETPLQLTPWGIQPSDRVLLFVGRLEEQKAPEKLVSAIATLFQAGKLAPTTKVILVGAGPQEDSLRRQIADGQLCDRVFLVGRQNQIARWMLASHGLILPSRWEGMPNVVLEAMACGLPVLASDVEGVSDLVTAGVTGWIFPANDVEAISSAILAWQDTPDQASLFGQAGKSRVRQEFSLRTMIDRYDRLYRRLLETSR